MKYLILLALLSAGCTKKESFEEGYAQGCADVIHVALKSVAQAPSDDSVRHYCLERAVEASKQRL